MDPDRPVKRPRWESPLREPPDDFPPFHSVSYSESMPVSQSQQGTPLQAFLPTSPPPTPPSPVAQMQYLSQVQALSPMVDFCGLKPMSQSQCYNPTTGLLIGDDPRSITPARNPTMANYVGPCGLFRFTPFGVYCHLCATSVSLTIPAFKTHIERNHNHTEENQPNPWDVISFQDMLHTASFEVDKLIGAELSAYVSGHCFSGFSCGGCSKCFGRRSNADRHLSGKTSKCIGSVIISEEVFNTVCGRVVRASTVRAARIPDGASTPYCQTESWLDKYVSGDEKATQYLSMFHPLQPQDENILNLVECWSLPPDEGDLNLADLLVRAETWLLDRARYDVGCVPANYRAAIQVFDGQDVGSVAVNYTYTFRHFEKSLLAEMKTMLCFAWRRSDQLPARNVLAGFKLSYDSIRHDPFLVPKILHSLAIESLPNFFQHPVVVEYCLARCFRKRGANLTMIKCDSTSTQVAATMSILRAGVCGYLCSKTDCADESALEQVRLFRTSRTANVLSPFTRTLKEMSIQKGVKRMKSVSPEGDILVQSFEFPKAIWSKLIVDVHKVCKQLLSSLLVGENWWVVLDMAVSVSVRLTEYQKVSFSMQSPDGNQFTTADVVVQTASSIGSEFDRLEAYLSFAFFGLGGGAMRGTEVENLLLSHATWHGNTFYYTTHSIKTYSYKSQTKIKTVEHKLPASLARVFLLYRAISCAKANMDSKRMLPGLGSTTLTLGDATTELFNFQTVPSITQVRQFITSISDLVFPGGNFDGIVSTTPEVAEMSAHSATTHRASYGSNLVGGRELVYRLFHREMGGDVCSVPASTSTDDVSGEDLLKGLRRIVGSSAKYTCDGQERMVMLAGRPNSRHAHIGLPCGSGKSMAWMVPATARILAEKSAKTIIVVLPYKFLMEYHLASALSIGLRRGIDISIMGFNATEIGEGRLPPLLQDIRMLPDILFLSLEGMHNLVSNHSPKLREWVKADLIHRIVIDEIHTVYTESYRNKYEILPSLVRFGVPVMTMSGSLPAVLVPFLISHLGMCTFDKCDDVDTVNGGDCLGQFPKDFRFLVKVVADHFVVATKALEEIMQRDPGHGVHVLCSSKMDAERILMSFFSRYECRMVTSDTASVVQAEVAKEWGEGKFQVLVSTTCALVGNENVNCRHVVVVGYLYSLVNIVQAVGRLRAPQRQQGASFSVFLPVRTMDQAMTEKSETTVLVAKLRNRNLLGDNRAVYIRLFTNQGLHDWVVACSGCRVKSLARLCGFERGNCGVCDQCRDRPTQQVAAVAERVVSTENVTRNSALLILASLREKCVVCRKTTCNGEKCSEKTACYCCGENHFFKTCRERKTTSVVLKGRACYNCYDLFQRRGAVEHNLKSCPLKYRLRRMIHARYLSSEATYAEFLATIYSDHNSFYKFVNSFSP